MKIPPDYKITSEILSLISKVDTNLMYLSSLTIPRELKQKIQRISLLKSSLFSARIEGNPLTLEVINKGETDKEKNREWLTPKDYQDIKLYDDLMNEEIAIGKDLLPAL